MPIVREIAKLLGGLLVLLLLIYFFRHGGNFTRDRSEPALLVNVRTASESHRQLCGSPQKSGHPVTVQFLYSADKRSWIEFAADRFEALCPNLHVKLSAMEDLEAVAAMLSGGIHPTIWAPTDDLSVRYLEHRLKQSSDPAPWHIEEHRSLVKSPLVTLIWQDRLRVLSTVLREQPSEEGQWVRSLCPGVVRNPNLNGIPPEQLVPGTWSDLLAPLLMTPPAKGKRRAPIISPVGAGRLPSLEQVQQWGRVKIGHTMPTRNLAGMSAIYLLSYEYILRPADRAALEGRALGESELDGRTPEQQSQLAQSFAASFAQKKDSLRHWLRRCEAGLELEPRSVEALTASLFHVGPSLLDAVVTYEHLTLPILDKIDRSGGHLPRMVVVYPRPTLIARHPAVLFKASSEEQEAARRWLTFLQSKAMQEKAIEFGFRPTSPEVSIGDHTVEQNRFLRLRRFGIQTSPQLQEAPPPDGSLLQELINLWGEATGRR